MSSGSLAINGGPRAVESLGPFPTKIGKEELLELIDMWELGPEDQQKVRQIIRSAATAKGPHLFRYYNPKPSKVAAAESAMRDLIGTKHCLGVCLSN